MRFSTFCFLLCLSCAYAEPIGEGMKAAAPIVAAVAPPGWGELGYYVLIGAGSLLAGYGAKKGYSHIKKA